MNIIVCIKQVPDTEDIKINKETNTIIREGVKAIINPFDMYALEEGIRLKEKSADGRLVALSMGNLAAAENLRDTISIGADEAVLLSDRLFAGADTLATAYTLSMGIKKMGSFDLIICGKQATDGDTAQVGPSLAEKLGITQITNVSKIEEISDRHIKCHRLTDYGHEVVEANLPVLITVIKDINEPRIATLRGIMRSRKASIPVWNAEDIGVDKDLCGLPGSPTQVVKIFTPFYESQGEILDGAPGEQAKKLMDKLKKSKYLT